MNILFGLYISLIVLLGVGCLCAAWALVVGCFFHFKPTDSVRNDKWWLGVSVLVSGWAVIVSLATMGVVLS